MVEFSRIHGCFGLAIILERQAKQFSESGRNKGAKTGENRRNEEIGKSAIQMPS